MCRSGCRAPLLLEIAGEGLFPVLLADKVSVLGEFAVILIVEILPVAAEQELGLPQQHPRGQDHFNGVAAGDRTGFGAIIGSLVLNGFTVTLGTPGISVGTLVFRNSCDLTGIRIPVQ